VNGLSCGVHERLHQQIPARRKNPLSAPRVHSDATRSLHIERAPDVAAICSARCAVIARDMRGEAHAARHSRVAWSLLL
jgi:hypothetical protein